MFFQLPYFLEGMYRIDTKIGIFDDLVIADDLQLYFDAMLITDVFLSEEKCMDIFYHSKTKTYICK